MRKSPLYSVLLLLIAVVPQAHAAGAAPSSVFDLSHWKLQIPGPKEVKALRAYSSSYFFLTADREMSFHLDASEKGTTADAHYVRSELRHLPNWKLTQSHSMSAEVRAVSHLEPDKVTVLQIHGIMEDGKDAPPLLRIALNKGDLVAVLKTDSAGDQGENIPLKPGLGSQWVKVDVIVQNQQLIIRVDGEEKVNRSLAYWKFFNYFKAGCYPQATSGTADVFFKSLSAK